MACVPLLLLLLEFFVLAPSPCFAQCPKNCQCTQQGITGSPSFKKTVDCSAKLGGLEVAPNVPTDATHLDLRNNRLKIVPSSLFLNTPNLKEVYLSGNPLTCDCQLYGLHNATRHLAKFTGTCYKPNRLRDKDIASLKLWDFCRGCALVKVAQNSNEDKEYSMEISANCDTHVRLFCRGMATDSPKEYITLISGQSKNYAYVHDYKQPSASRDKCVKASGGSMYTEAGLTNFSKVLVDLNSMSIVPDDFYYSTTSSGKRIKYGEAGDCYSASKESCRKGKFQIDLTGTGFRLKEEVYWEPYGTPSDIENSLDIDEDRTQVSAECGGYCGGCRAHGGNLAVELDYCPQEGIKTCYDPLGMANGSISNGQITASSQKIGKDKSFKAEYGRLNNKPSGAMGGAWCAQSSDKFQYLQIDLNKEMTLSGVATQGQIDAPNWVVKYSIQHSTDGTNWKDYKEFGHDRAFDGNVDQHNVVTNWFNQRFRARYVRIKPGLYSSPTNTICLRAELYGCVTDIVSVIIRSSSTKNCWSPRTISNPCEISDGSLFTLQSFCQGEGVMMAFRRDGSLIHSCSGKCVFKNAKDQLALRDGLCDTFAKRENPDGTIAISHQASGLCVRVDAGKNLILSNCSSPHLFETTQSGLHPISPKFKRNSPQYLTLNKPGWIHCQVISDPRAKLFWTKTLPWPNGEHLPDLEFLPFSNGSLFVRKAKKSYEGDFYCTAVNSGGIKLQDITVKVAELPNFVKRPSDLTTSVNNSVMFDCKATSDLGVKYSWFQLVKGSSTSTSVLKLDNRFNIFPNGSLNIRSVQKKDEAFYHCRAENPIGFNNVTAFLRVLVPPRFTIQPLGSAEPSGSSPVYNCQAVGDPVPTIRWTKVGSAQTPTEQLKNGSLLLRNIQKSDEGQYTCSATNIVKTATAKITISVYTACRIDSQPNAFHRPDRKFFAVGEKVIVDCKPGFEKKQDGNLSCKADGNWNKRFPQCNDLDECAILSLPSSTQNSTKLRSCHDKARCVNTLGSYRCECTRGYAGDGFSCTAVCLPPSDDDNGEWMPNKPTYRIAETVWLNCDLGYKLADSDVSSVTCGKDTEWSTPNPSCQDKNECEEGSPCHKNADCVNTVGSFTCRCKERFEGDGVTECKEQKTRLVTGSDGKVWKYSAKMTDLNEKLKQFNDENISAEDLLATVLNSSTPSSGQPMAGDLVMIVMGMDTVLSNLNSIQRMASAKQVIQISSHILDKKNKEQWSEVQKDSKGVTEVMALLDKFAMKLASDLEKQSSENATVDIKTNNIEMKVMVKDANKFSTDVEYPQSSKQSNDGSAQIRLPQELFAKYKGDLPVKVTSFLFEDLGELLPKRGEGIKRFDVSSPIVSSSLSPVPSEGKLDPPVTITMRNKKPSDVEAVDKCVYWDFEKSKELGGSWSSDGCQMLSSGSNGTVCACDHLTSFALLSVYDKELVFGLKIYIGCGVLLLAVVLALIRHLYLYCKRRYERSIIHINLCLAIAAGIALFLGGLRLTKIPAVCTIVAALLQFFFIAMFCWAVCEGLQLFMTLATGKNKNSTRLKFFFIIGWIFPLIAVGVSLGVTQLQGYGNDEWCWLDYSHVLMWSYVCPAAGFTLVTLVLVVMILCYKGRVVDSKDRRKVCLSVLFLIFLIIAIAGTWVVAAIYVRHHEKSLWQYLFAGACILQGSLLLVYCFLDQTVKNFTFHYQIKRMQSKEKRNYYSTTDTVQYYGANAVDGKYKVTRPSIKESNTDLRGSSKRLSRIGSTTSGVFYDKEEYPPPIMDTPAPMDSAIKRKIEGLPIPDSPGGDVIQLQSFPNRKGSSSYYSLVASESTSDRDRRPDGAEEPEMAMGERRYSKTSMRKSADNLLSSHSRLQQIPERQPLMHSGYHQPESPESPPPYKIGERQRPFENKRKSPFEEDHFYGSRDTALDSSRRKSRRSRRRLEEEFGKSDRESISQRKKSLRYSSGFFSGVTVEQDSQKVEKPHASL